MNEGASILAVDDSSEALALLREVLTGAGYRARLADSGELAMSAIDAGVPDLVLLDVHMAGMDGFEVCRQLKARDDTRLVPIVVVTGTGTALDVVEALRAGAVDYILKPFRSEELLARVHTQLSLVRATRALEEQAATLLRTNAQLRDEITERKRAEDEQAALQNQLAQAQKMESVGRLAGGVAHDYNNMLAAIIGHAELGLLQADVPPALRDDLTAIHEAATRSAKITQQLLTFARKQVIRPQMLDLNVTVANSLKMLQPLIGEQVQFTWSPAADLWPVTMDATQVEQILANLCLNARDAIEGVGTLDISTANRVVDATLAETFAEAVPGDFVKLTVTDSGCGMSPAVLAHIFEPFYTTKDVGEGSGLGLASVYGAVRQNGGFVTVASVEGEGTTVDLYFPRASGTLAASPVAEPPAPMISGHETVLVVEDETAVRRMTVRALEGKGYTVLEADSPREAMRLAQEQGAAIALLLTDVMMPEMNGHALAATLRAAHPQLKHLFMSGYPMRDGEGDGQMEDAAHFLAKPFTLAALTAKVREVLDGE